MIFLLIHILLLLMIAHALCFAAGKVYVSKHNFHGVSSSSLTSLSLSSSSLSLDEYNKDENDKSVTILASENNIIENSSSLFSLAIMSIGAVVTGMITGLIQLRIRKALILLDSLHQINNNYWNIFIHLIGGIFISIAYKFLKSKS